MPNFNKELRKRKYMHMSILEACAICTTTLRCKGFKVPKVLFYESKDVPGLAITYDYFMNPEMTERECHIYISSDLHNEDKHFIRGVIYHELTHAIVGNNNGHKKVWRHMAARIMMATKTSIIEYLTTEDLKYLPHYAANLAKHSK